MKTICIIGLGYIGLPTATLLASSGYRVHGVDVKDSVVKTLNAGKVHIAEPELDDRVARAVASGMLKASTSPQPADVFFICVPTPFKPTDGDPDPDISLVLAAAELIAPFVRNGNTVILESTSPVGTTKKVGEVLARHGCDISKLHIAYCPERVLPGRIMKELVENDRVVGGLDDAATKAVSEFYRSFVTGEVLETNAQTAEMCKLAENSFRDVNIAFANELSMVCASQDINVWELIKLANRHPRVNILQPGIGVGGHCIAVDPWFLVASDPGNAQLTRMARQVNTHKTEWAMNRILEALLVLKQRGKGEPKIACYGLAFKPDTDDLRESPALNVALNLQKRGLKVVAVEPHIREHSDLEIVSADAAEKAADLHLVFVRHKVFREPGRKERLKALKAMDFCGLFDLD
jgi:UDP-N-acetyl-D-mannosaminuronic acid dehydrogenase